MRMTAITPTIIGFSSRVLRAQRREAPAKCFPVSTRWTPDRWMPSTCQNVDDLRVPRRSPSGFMTHWSFVLRKLAERDGEERFALTLASDELLKDGRENLSIQAPLSLMEVHERLEAIGVPRESLAKELTRARAKYDQVTAE